MQLGLDGPDANYLSQVAENILKIKDRYGDVFWGCSTMASYIDEELLTLLTSSGCRSIGVGVEYMSDAVLTCIDKGITIDDVFRTFDLLRKFNIWGHFCYIDFAPYICEEYTQEHRGNLEKILGHKYDKLSFSLSKLYSNKKLDRALRELNHIRVDG